jgi:hypothetical protein
MLPLVEPWNEKAQVKVQEANSSSQSCKNDAYDSSSPLNMEHGQGINSDEMAQRDNSRNDQANSRKDYENDNIFT